VERIGRSIGGRFEFFPRVEFFPTVQTKTGLTGFPNRSDRFSPVGCREEILSKEVKDRLGDQRGGSEWEPIKILLEGD
jgi:hypothetical protein